jgi:hypothetical protein
MGRRSLALALGAALALPAVAAAHVTRVVGPYRLTVGWADEPAYTGSRNAVDVTVSNRAGAPIDGARLTAQVSFGDARTLLPLVPVDDEPGALAAAIVPTRPGTYGFRIAGRIRRTTVDVGVTCSDRTFECPVDASEIQFPVKEAPSADVSEGLRRALGRADRARAEASTARDVAIAALAVAGLAIATALAAVLRRRRSGT